MAIIAQFSDTHITADERGVVPDDSGPVRALRAAVSALLALPARPDAVVLTGDLTEAGRAAEYDRLRALLSPLPMPVHPMPGNHDDRDALRAAFGAHPAVAATADGPLAPVQYAVDVAGTRLVCCDTTVPGSPYGAMDPERLAWLDDTLAAEPGTPTVVATHHPPYPIGIRFIDDMRFRDTTGFAEVIRRHDQVIRMISGHVHRGSAGTFAGRVSTTCPSTYRQLFLDLSRPGRAAVTGEPAGFAVHLIGKDGGATTHFVPSGSHRPLMDVE
ncbi:phosphodiesterase [Actinomadura sp. SCN-SB]|uniref:phosphodiesterase n=1 Tax=Actinomadura sp. SCN-SB TaxID=3373092 RepID=UPI0037531AEA